MGFLRDLFYFIRDYKKEKYVRFELPRFWKKDFSIEMRSGNAYLGVIIKITYTYDLCRYAYTKIEKKEGEFMLSQKDRDEIFDTLRPLDLGQVTLHASQRKTLDSGSTDLTFKQSNIDALRLHVGHGTIIGEGSEEYTKAFNYLVEFAQQRLPNVK